jgi:hypothetical protein
VPGAPFAPSTAAQIATLISSIRPARRNEGGGDSNGSCDVLVTGELEGIAPRLFADLERGCWQCEYQDGRPELDDSPLPRWDLYPNDGAMVGCVQTSRGCPFDCEFCDVIANLGRKQRHKPVSQVIAELNQLRSAIAMSSLPTTTSPSIAVARRSCWRRGSARPSDAFPVDASIFRSEAAAQWRSAANAA